MIVLRILENGQCVREKTYPNKTIRMGRNEDAELLLTDPSVSKDHAILSQDHNQRWLLRDNESRNGIRTSEGLVSEVFVEKPLKVWIGKQEIEIVPISKDDTKEVDVTEWNLLDRRRGWTHYSRSLTSIFLGTSLLTLLTLNYWLPTQHSIGYRVLFNLILAFLVSTTAAALLLVSLRTMGRKLRYADSLKAMSTLIWLLVIDVLLHWLSFYILPLRYRYWTLTGIEFGILTGGLLYLMWLRKDDMTAAFRWTSTTLALLLSTAIFLLLFLITPYEGTAKLTDDVYPDIFGYHGPSQNVDQIETTMNELISSLE